MHLVIALMGCNSTPAPAPAQAPVAKVEEPAERKPGKVYRLEFEHLEIEDAHLTATEPSTADGLILGLDRIPLTFRTIYKRGDDGFGDRLTLSGKPIPQACNSQDFNGLFASRGASWLVSHFECTPGEIVLTRLQADDAGVLTPDFNKRVDFSAHKGLWNPCAGMITPWGTHLGSEEYEPNAAKVPVSLKEDGWDYRSWSRMQELYLEGAQPNPYDYGWTPEVAVMTADGDALAVKHKSMGRFSHEIATVMPDRRTVYLTDDGRAGGFFMFVADKAADLSAGKLYAARFIQSSTENGGAGDLKWIPFGTASDAWVDSLIQKGVTFDDLFDKAPPTAEAGCPEGMIFTQADNRTECLSVKKDSEKVPNVRTAASRLETRRMAAFLGATTEFEKEEGLAFDPEHKVLYIAFAKIGGRMVAETKDARDHIQLEPNPCGAVWSGGVVGGQNDIMGGEIESDYVLTSIRSFVRGKPIEADARGNTCAELGIANPDNIAFLPFYQTLMIAEDTSRHAVASLWALDTGRGSMNRVMVSPPHGEFTGISWSPNLGGHGYLTVAIQHPWRAETLADTTLPEGVTAEHQKSITGYLGPFPVLD